eukprot:scaffold14142_cov14-Tisochrysis_lutea.AAC.1
MSPFALPGNVVRRDLTTVPGSSCMLNRLMPNRIMPRSSCTSNRLMSDSSCVSSRLAPFWL